MVPGPLEVEDEQFCTLWSLCTWIHDQGIFFDSGYTVLSFSEILDSQ